MRKLFLISAFIMTVIVAAHILLFAAVPVTPLNVYVNGEQQENVLVVKGRTLVPLRAFDDPTQFIYTFDYISKTVNIINKVNQVSIQISVGAQEATINGKKVNLDAQVTLKDGRIFVPLRFLSENLGGNFIYDKVGKKVVVGYPIGRS